MKPSQAALLAGILLIVGCQPSSAQQAGAQQVYCGRVLTVSAGATSITAAVTATTTQIIAVCGVTINAGAAAATFKLTVGTGTNCNANTTDITPAWSLGINGQMVDTHPVAWYSTPSGQVSGLSWQLCYTITGTGPMNANVYYHLYGG
jgi:hypothetical protein